MNLTSETDEGETVILRPFVSGSGTVEVHTHGGRVTGVEAVLYLRRRFPDFVIPEFVFENLRPISGSDQDQERLF